MIRVLIADDHPVVREGLKRIVADCSDMQVVGEADNGDAVVAQSRSAGADVLLLDISMPGPGFVETMRRLRKAPGGPRVLVLSVHPEDQFAVRAIRMGAVGYLTKDRSPEELAQAIRRVYGGGRYITASLAESLVFQLVTQAEPPHAALSEREFQVLCKLGSGKSVRDVAGELGLSPKTVSTHRARIAKKLGLTKIVELVRYAIEHNLID